MPDRTPLSLRVAYIGVGALLAATVARIGGWPAAAAAGLVGMTALSPVRGLMVLAGFLPLGSILTGILNVKAPLTDVIVLAFLAGAALHRGVAGGTRPIGGVHPARLLILVVAASYAVRLVEIHARLGDRAFGENLRLLLAGHYLRGSVNLEGLAVPVTFIAGVALFAVTRRVVADPAASLPAMTRVLAAGAGAAAALNVFRLFEIALRSGEPPQAFVRLATQHRINVHYADVNAAGSYFALMIFLPVALAAWSRSTARLFWFLVAVLIGTALWLTGSRAALLSIVLVAGAAAIDRWRRSPGAAPLRRRVVPLLAVGTLAVLVVMFLPNRVIGPGTSVALEVRRDMAIASLHLLRQQPLFGIGIGEFHSRSAEPLRDLPTGRYYFRENAHNNFLQIGAELGLVGLGIFVWLLTDVAHTAYRTLQSSHTRMLHIGYVCAIAAFLLSALLGHPLLTPDVAYAFWLVLGIAAAGKAAAIAKAQTSQKVAVALAILVLLSIPVRGKATLREAELDHVGYGLSGWRIAEEGTRYRTAAGAATVFVPANAALLEIPLRLNRPAAEPVLVEIAFDGKPVDRIHITSAWRHYRSQLPAAIDRRFVPISFQIVGEQPVPLDVGKVIVLQNRR